MPTIKPTKELIDKLTKAQMKLVHELSGSDHWQHSDDGWDYAQAAVRLASIMLAIYYDRDINRLASLLNDVGGDEALTNFACDGVAQEFYDLKPNSLDYLNE